MKPALQRAPSHLSAASKAVWRGVVATYALEIQQLRVLELACTALDEAEEARAEIKANGSSYVDRWGQPKAVPAVAHEQAAALRATKCFRELNLDLEPGKPKAPRAPF